MDLEQVNTTSGHQRAEMVESVSIGVSVASLLAGQRSTALEAYRRDTLAAVGKGGIDGGWGRRDPTVPWYTSPWISPATDGVSVSIVERGPVYATLEDATAQAAEDVASALLECGVLEQAVIASLVDEATAQQHDVAMKQDARRQGLRRVEVAMRHLHALRLLYATVDRAEPDLVVALRATKRDSIVRERSDALSANSASAVAKATQRSSDLFTGSAEGMHGRVGVRAISVVVSAPVVVFESMSDFAARGDRQGQLARVSRRVRRSKARTRTPTPTIVVQKK